MAYVNFERQKFPYLSVTSIGLDYVMDESNCGFACVNISSYFSFNLAAFHDINGKVLLPPRKKVNFFAVCIRADISFTDSDRGS